MLTLKDIEDILKPGNMFRTKRALTTYSPEELTNQEAKAVRLEEGTLFMLVQVHECERKREGEPYMFMSLILADNKQLITLPSSADGWVNKVERIVE